MALMYIRKKRELELRKAKLAENRTTETELQTREAELVQKIDNATEEEMETLNAELDEFEQLASENKAEREALEQEVSTLETELAALEQQRSAPPAAPTAADREERAMKQNVNYEHRQSLPIGKRARIAAMLKDDEVREFFTTVKDIVANKRSLGETGLLIPEIVVDMIQTGLGDQSTLYGEVTVRSFNGTSRFVMDGAIPEGIWVEDCDPVQELSRAFSSITIDSYKVCGFMPVCNAILDDSFINLAAYIIDTLTMAIAKAIDKAILTGQETLKQPTGIIPSLDAANKVTVTSADIPEIMTHISLIDDGEEGPPAGEIIAVMRRKTYYKRFMPQLFTFTADGRLVTQMADNAILPGGIRIKFSSYMAEDTILFGEFKKYILAERQGIRVDTSKEVKFIEDQTVTKATARYDGTPAYKKRFALVTIQEPAPEPEEPAA